MNLIKRILPFLLIIFGPMLMLHHIWANPLSAGEDDAVYYYPLRVMVGQQLKQGHLPLSNPVEATGIPLMADPQSAVMYPPTWLFAAMNSRLAYSLSIFLAFSLAGIGAYLYLRRLGLRSIAATVGATAFMYCGFMVGHRVHLSAISTACYLPWGLWCIEMMRGNCGLPLDSARGPEHVEGRIADCGFHSAQTDGEPKLLRDGRARWLTSPRMLAFVWLAPIVYLALMAGHWPTFIYLTMIWCVYLAFRGRPFFATAGVAVLAVVMATLVASPQLHVTSQLLMGSTRERIGYAIFGENSFFPTSAILGLFPMIMGSRTPNFFPQQWWGSWHLCEMLGYVGLLTLALGVAAVWKLYRKPKTSQGRLADPATSIVRVWTWIGAGAFIWMLGFYLPTYKLIHLLPILNIVRCPARMVLALDMALAALAAIAVDRVIDHALWAKQLDPSAISGQALAHAIKRALTRVLPVAMVGAVVLFAAVAWMFRGGAGALGTQFTGSAQDALVSLNPANPAIWVQFVLLTVSVAGGLWWLGNPTRRGPILVLVLLADLFMVTGFVDSPAKDAPVVRDSSPAAQWLNANAPQKDTYRIWGMSENYHHRPDELLLPKTCETMGFASIANYGPFQSPHHAHLFGFEIFGSNRDWESLLTKNYLLSMYNVKYIIASNPLHRQALESLVIDDSARSPDGPEMLTGTWPTKNQVGHTSYPAPYAVKDEVPGPAMIFKTPLFWEKAEAQQPVVLEAGQVYRIALDACGPDGGAANCLRADIYMPKGGSIKDDWSSFLVIPSDQIGPNWRHFEWVFTTPDLLVGQTVFRVLTYSERPIHVANVSLKLSTIDRPVNLGGKLTPGDHVYRKVAQLPAVWHGQSHAVQAAQGFSQSDQWAEVAIYENLLCQPRPDHPGLPATYDTIETLKWGREIASCDQPGSTVPSAPDISMPVPAPSKWLLLAVAPGALTLHILLVGCVLLVRRRILRKLPK